MGTSVPFLVTGLSGKILTQNFPPFFKYLMMALLAASICLAVTHFDSTACKPKLPKANSVPRLSIPCHLLLPLCHFLCFTFLGINIFFIQSDRLYKSKPLRR